MCSGCLEISYIAFSSYGAFWLKETHLATGRHQVLKKEVEKLKLVLAKLPERQQVKKSF